jgi:hypothetical protein
MKNKIPDLADTMVIKYFKEGLHHQDLLHHLQRTKLQTLEYLFKIADEYARNSKVVDEIMARPREKMGKTDQKKDDQPKQEEKRKERYDQPNRRYYDKGPKKMMLWQLLNTAETSRRPTSTSTRYSMARALSIQDKGTPPVGVMIFKTPSKLGN